MLRPDLRRLLRRMKNACKRHPDRFLAGICGVIHIGANTGQERNLYNRRQLRVLWVEPIPEVFETLKANIAGYPQQRAVQYLVTDRDDAEYAFHVASNNGASSSILDLKLHKDIWPEVSFTREVAIRSVTLPTLLVRESIDIGDYDALVMDTQGSELLVLQGAAAILGRLRFIKTEVPDFEAYAGCCQLRHIEQFLTAHGFREQRRHKFAERAAGGSYYDVTYERNPLARHAESQESTRSSGLNLGGNSSVGAGRKPSW